jgi:hypothetical protein
MRLIDADSVPIEPSFNGKAMKAMLDMAATVTCETCKHAGKCRMAVEWWHGQPSYQSFRQPVGGCSLWEARP